MLYMVMTCRDHGTMAPMCCRDQGECISIIFILPHLVSWLKFKSREDSVDGTSWPVSLDQARVPNVSYSIPRGLQPARDQLV